LKLKYDEPLPNLAFNFNLHRYNMLVVDSQVGRCRLNPVDARVESAWFHRLKLKHEKQISSFAFNLNLRRYRQDDGANFVVHEAWTLNYGGAVRVANL